MLFERVEHHTAVNGGVRIHYVTLGKGPALLFVHGFPDFWYLWHKQMNGLCGDYRCIAMDLRGMNKSDKPKGVEAWDMKNLKQDIAAVIKASGEDKVTLIAHDAGGFIAWYFAMDVELSSMIDGLIVLNVTHPRGFSRALAVATPELAKYTAYARTFQDPSNDETSAKAVDAIIAKRVEDFWSKEDPRVQAYVDQGHARNDRYGLADFYKANYFRPPYKEQTGFPQIKVPVLQFHGLADLAVYKDGLAETWDWIDADYTLITYPGIGHIPHLEKPDAVTTAMRGWLKRHHSKE